MDTPKDVLESLVDKHGIAGIIRLLSEICWDKAEHVRTNWQSYDLMEAAWEAIGEKLNLVYGNRSTQWLG